MIIETSDFSLIDQVFVLRLTATAVLTSGNSATDAFTVSFTDGCSDAELAPVSNINVVGGGSSVSLYEELVI